jgi:hypothetical protein
MAGGQQDSLTAGAVQIQRLYRQLGSVSGTDSAAVGNGALHEYMRLYAEKKSTKSSLTFQKKWKTIQFYPDSKHCGQKVLKIRLEKKQDEGMY